MANIIDNLNTLNTNIDNAKFKIAKNLKDKGVQALPSDKLDILADKIVDIPSGSCNLQELNVVENGTYTPQAGDVKGYNKVTVNVPSLGDNLDWSAIGYSENPANYEKIVEDGYNYAKQIYDTWDATQTNLTNKFRDDNNLVFMPAVDTSAATNMGSMFFRCGNLKSVPPLDTSSCTYMWSMFCMSPNLETIGTIDTSKNTDFSQMFTGCVSLISIPPIDLSSAEGNTMNMFTGCSSLQSITLTGDPSKITSVGDMFGSDERTKLADNGVLTYDHRYDYTAIINELKKWNPTWTAKPDNQ